MSKGFIIYALGHRNYYHMAETLAVSMKYNNSAVKIALLCDDSEKVRMKDLFEKVESLEMSQFLENEKFVFNRATICMYDHSPYDITIKLDADMIWLDNRDPLQLFEDLKEHDIVLQNRGHGWNKQNSVWTDEKNLQEAYGFTEADRLYKIYGEFVYFKKNRQCKKFFDTVKRIFNKPKVKCAAFSNGTFTDELAYQIACMQLGIELPDNYTPVLNSFLGYNDLRFKHAYQLPASFYAYSIGGNFNHQWMKEQYNILAKHYYYQLRLQNPYQVKDKRSFLPERQKL